MSEADHLHKYLKEKNLHAIFVKLTEEVLRSKPGKKCFVLCSRKKRRNRASRVVLVCLSVTVRDLTRTSPQDNPIGFIVELLLRTYQDECKGILHKPPPSLVVAKPKGAELDDPSSDDGEEVLTDESVEGESAETSLKVPLKKKRRESVSAEKLPDGKCPRAPCQTK